MWGDFSGGRLWGINFFYKKDKLVLAVGMPSGDESKEFTLGEHCRLLDVKSVVEKGQEPCQSDVTFIIGCKDV